MKSRPLQQLQPSPSTKMDPDYDISLIPRLDSSVISAKRYESSRIVQLNFKIKEELDIAIQFGIKIEYCLF